ncbi:MAG TPA: hypothetical protein PKX62_16495 [Spirochaetota bacterium]|nr:hypothetical protein [Bacteroidales bacterium]HQF09711.1 hypothetical protein [Spirochaetota bacterium]HRS78495.1 hypothetical protein [Spirochaetota bacterium]
MKKAKFYKSLYEKSTTDIESQLLSYLDRAIVKYQEARDMLATMKVTEAINISKTPASLTTRIKQGNRLLDAFWDNVKKAEKSGYEISLYLFVMCRSRLVGASTAITKDFSISSQYSGACVKSILIEINGMKKNIIGQGMFFTMYTSYQVACYSFNQYVNGNQKRLNIVPVNKLLIPKKEIFIFKG